MDQAAQAAGGPPLGESSEDELLQRARAAMTRATSLPPGSLGRSIQWGVFDTVMDELRRRAITYLAARLSGGSGQ